MNNCMCSDPECRQLGCKQTRNQYQGHYVQGPIQQPFGHLPQNNQYLIDRLDRIEKVLLRLEEKLAECVLEKK